MHRVQATICRTIVNKICRQSGRSAPLLVDVHLHSDEDALGVNDDDITFGAIHEWAQEFDGNAPYGSTDGMVNSFSASTNRVERHVGIIHPLEAHLNAEPRPIKIAATDW